jgi:hypothetical protein
MSFGFDPSLILSAQQTPQTTLGDLVNAANSGQQRQLQQAQLQEALFKQQRERTLADLVSQNAGSYDDPMAQAYARGGFGQEAADAAQQNLKLDALHTDVLRSRLSTVKNQDQYAKLRAQLSPDALRKLEQFGLTDTYDPEAHQAFIASGLEPDKRGAFEAAEQRRQALADANSPTSQMRTAVAKLLGLPVAPGTAGNAIDDKELDLGEKAQAAKERRASLEAMGRLRYGPGGADSYSQEAVDAMALNALRTGHMQQFGPGATGAALRQRVMNRMPELASGAAPGSPSQAGTPRTVPDLASAAAQFEADKHSLKEARGAADAIDRNEAKAEADLSVLEGTIKDLGLTDTKMLNTPLLKLKDMSGSPAVSAFMTARTATISQISKTLSANPNQVTEGIRHEAEDLIREDLTPAQFAASVRVLRQDMARNKIAMHKSVENISARMAGKKAAPEADAGPPASGATMDAAKVSARIKELVASGVNDRDEIKRRLRAEGLAP